MARTRRIVALLTLLGLIVIVAGVSGWELPLFRPAGPERLVPGVRAVSSSVLLRVGSGAPPGGELAFLAVEPGGNLMVSDARRRTVMRFDPSGHLVSEWGPRLADATLAEPAGVAVQGDDFYVVDRGTPRIFRLDVSGRLKATFNLETLGTYGLNGLAVDPGGNVYVADTGRNRILVFAQNGTLLRQVGRGGSELGGFTQPMMLAIAPDGSFFVADWENSRIQRWDSSYTAVHAWSTGFRPFGIAVDETGRLFVPDTERRRVQAFSDQGAPLGEMGSPGSPPIEVAPKQLAIARSARPSLYVLGGDGVIRVDLENTPPPPQGGADIDVVSLMVIGLLAVVLVGAVQARRARRNADSLGAALDRPVGLDAKNGGQREHQQARANEDLLIANQAKRKQ